MKKFTLNSGPVLIVIAAFLWALDGILRRHLYTLPPITIIFFEHLIGLLIITPFVWKKVTAEKLSRRNALLLAFIALFSGLLGTLWFTTALLKVHYISFSVVFLLQKLQPLFAISSAGLLLKEKFDKRYIKWALLALISAYFVTFKNGYVDTVTGEGILTAALYALGAAFAWGTSTTFSKMVLTKVTHTTSTFYRFFFTTIMATIVLFAFGYGSSLQTLTMPQIGFFIAIALSTGVVALLIYYKGLAKTPVHISTMLELTFPFIAILIDVFMYHTVLAWSQYLAAVILTFSIYQIARLQSYALPVKTN
jgi:drug/metabolite transporter (DMT)-like permease